MLDTRLSWLVLLTAIVSLFFPWFPALIDPLLIHTAVRSIENIQAFMLFGFAIFTLFYMKPWQLQEGKKQFWFWAVCWWILLFGRSISWGRDYFPDVPKIYFRGISIILIGNVVFMLFSPQLRKEITHKFKTFSLPLWPFLLAVAGLIISDAIEHLRAIHTLFLSDLKHQSLIEELYEFPLILGLFLTAFVFMKKDNLGINSKQS